MQQYTLPQVVHQMQQFAGQVQQSMGLLQATIDSLKKRVCELEAVNALHKQGRSPRRTPTFRSQYGEDCAVWDMLGGQTRGFYVEVGAFDGKHFAVTYAFDAMGWDGLLIEAIPERFQQCKVNRPDARVVHAALGPESGGAVTFHVTQDRFGGMLSFADPASDHGRQTIQAGVKVTTVQVPQTSLNALLEGHAGPIDVAVIDVEGGEVSVLKGFDLERFRPRILLLEDNKMNAATPLTNYMRSQAYHLVGTLEVNRIYVHKGEREILERINFRA